MAAASPKAVASNASAMPGATTARLVVCDFEMPMKLFMMPQTVPNKPTKGAVAPIVASTPVPRKVRRPWLASIRPCASLHPLGAPPHPFVDAFLVGGTGQTLPAVRGPLEELHARPLSVATPLLALRRGAYEGELIKCPPHTALGQHDLYGFGEPH